MQMKVGVCRNARNARTLAVRRQGRAVSLLQILALMAAAASIVMLVRPAAAQGNPQSAGPVLERHCATCHVVPGYPDPQRRMGFDAPDFTAIAADPSTYTRTRLTLILREPHYPMTTFILSPNDVDNVVAYLLGMQAQ